MRVFQVLWILLPLLLVSSAFAQKVDTTNVGYLQGQVKEANNKHIVQFATISVYKVADSSLVSYQMTNNAGAFHFRKLPVGIPLEVIVSHTGYLHFHQKFIIPPDSKKTDLKELLLQQSTVQLKEVVISNYRPPVQMKGDTLEFNAEAFKLDKNAVVGDLLKKLPGVTIWGDGKITINGRTVQNVYVDGKPFFGDNGKVAIQNLPKNVVDKIQVYNKRDDNRSPLDSIMNVNIKLRNGKKHGLFGKIGAGYGTNKRFAADGMLSTFSPLTQLSVAGAANNVNVMANDISTLVTNSSFKGVGVNIEYQSDFELQGLNRSIAGGGEFLHYFIPDASTSKTNNLGAKYFIKHNNNELYRNTQTVINLNGEDNLIQKENSTTNILYTTQNFKNNYSLQNEKIDFYAIQTFDWNRNKYDISSISTSETNSGEGQSRSNAENNQTWDNKNYSLRTGLKDKKRYFKIDYLFKLNSDMSEQNNKRIFISPIFPDQNTVFNRSYKPRFQNISNEIDLNYDNLNELIFGRSRFFKIKMGLLNYLKINTNHGNNTVTDLDTVIQKHVLNAYLTNKTQYNTMDERPGIKFERTFIRTLSNRYKKTLYLYGEARGQFFNQKNTSEKEFQNFDHSYNNFLPKANIRYLNNQYGDYEVTYDLGFNTLVDYPTADQIAPLTDSANVFYQQRGNPGIQPSYKKELTFLIAFNSFHAKKILDNFNVNLRAGYTNNAIVDSTVYDNLGRAVNYSINAATRSKYVSLNLDLKKALRFKEHQLQFSSSTANYFSREPRYINTLFMRSDNLNSDNMVGVMYTFKDVFAIEARERLLFIRAKQTGSNGNEFNSFVQRTIISASLNSFKRLTLNSNINFVKNTSTYTASNTFTIWNANLSCRLMKGNQAEVKFSALDLLRQNKGIINDFYSNNLTTGNVNVLQQYFMITFSFFPRKFGKG